MGVSLGNAAPIAIVLLALVGAYIAWKYVRPTENKISYRIEAVEEKFTELVGELQSEIHKFRDDLREEIQTNREAAIVRDSDLSRLLATNQAVLESLRNAVDRQTTASEKNDAALIRFSDNMGQFRATLASLDGRLKRIEDFHSQEALDASHNRRDRQ